MGSRIYSAFTNIREFITPAPTGPSTFRETGNITVEEFVEAGDYLVSRFPTWSWQAGPPSRRKDHLPPDKQYLVTHRVPCRHRPKALEREAAAEAEQLVETGDDEAWVATHTDRHARPAAAPEDVPDIDMTEEDEDGARDMDIDDIPGLEDMQMPSDDESDDEAARKLYTPRSSNSSSSGAKVSSDRTVRTRTYDLYITYDKYWRCPRLWLFGYTALGAPLPVQAIMEDISTDYVDKTVTMETWPYMEGASMSMATVHPCKHSHVMQIIIARQEERGKQVRVDQYLVIFLKFMGSVIPTIEHDNTMGF